jgi:hypothetical protein
MSLFLNLYIYKRCGNVYPHESFFLNKDAKSTLPYLNLKKGNLFMKECTESNRWLHSIQTLSNFDKCFLSKSEHTKLNIKEKRLKTEHHAKRFPPFEALCFLSILEAYCLVRSCCKGLDMLQLAHLQTGKRDWRGNTTAAGTSRPCRPRGASPNCRPSVWIRDNKATKKSQYSSKTEGRSKRGRRRRKLMGDGDGDRRWR